MIDVPDDGIFVDQADLIANDICSSFSADQVHASRLGWCRWPYLSAFIRQCWIFCLKFDFVPIGGCWRCTVLTFWKMTKSGDRDFALVLLPPLRRLTVGCRSFPVIVSILWNSPPLNIQSFPSLPVSCQHLKTFLFQKSFPESLLWQFRFPTVFAILATLTNCDWHWNVTW